MPSETDGTPNIRTLQIGTVVQNDDPLKLGRVKLAVPGLIVLSDWALPLGGVGGGTAQRGIFDTPDVGAEVGVLFAHGDVDHPYYLVANWGAPGGKAETPGPVGGYATPNHDASPGTPEDIPPEDAAKVKAWETAKWVIVLDDRDGHEVLYLEHKLSGDHIKMFGKPRYAMEISVTGTLRIKAEGQLSLESNNITINGRPVLATGKAIY